MLSSLISLSRLLITLSFLDIVQFNIFVLVTDYFIFDFKWKDTENKMELQELIQDLLKTW